MLKNGIRLLRTHIVNLRYRIHLYWKRELSEFTRSLKILDSEQTIKKIISENLSVCRYGDGEFYVMGGGKNGFQSENPILAARLREVITNPRHDILLCVPISLKRINHMRAESRNFALGFLLNHGEQLLMPVLDKAVIYGDSLFTRFYMMRKDKSNLMPYVLQLKQIWNNRNILIVEGSDTRLGIGNDLFANASSIRRILCPNRDAFDHYDEILAKTINYVKDSDLVLLSLGMTATVMAYDLAVRGFRAIDTGHIDMEYEWMIMGAYEKVPIPNKIVDEVIDGKPTDQFHNDEYESQIICRICV